MEHNCLELQFGGGSDAFYWLPWPPKQTDKQNWYTDITDMAGLLLG